MIDLAGVCVAFDSETVLGPIDVAFGADSFVGLIGPPGSGKSIILKVIAGLVRASAGSARILGQDVGMLDEAGWRELRRRIGMVFQNNALFDSKTIGENVAFALRRRGIADESLIREVVERSLSRVGLAGTEHLYPHELSGGMQKRAGIARATAFDPEICLYDEPTAGLDPVTSARILELIRTNQATRKGVSIVISNEMDSMLSVVPRVIMVHRGRVVFDGPRADLDTGRAPDLARRFVAGDLEAPL
jgi:phospholipid/cholesterol/gamma-HCH transport system ATP-binding protein